MTRRGKIKVSKDSGQDEGFDRRYAIGLEFHHERRSPDEVTAALRIEPRRCWDKGTLCNRPDGSPLAGRRADNYWHAEFVVPAFDHAGGVGSIGVLISACLDQLEEQKDFIADYAGDRGRGLLHIYWNFARSTSEDVLTIELMRRLAEFRLNVELHPLSTEV